MFQANVLGRGAKKKASRRRGYRGYGSVLSRYSAAYGGTVHWGRGFTGVQFPEMGGETLLAAGLFTPVRKEKASQC